MYDTIIVGAGSAGAILAARLTEDRDMSVLLVEAGPDYADLDDLPPDVKFGYGLDRSVSSPMSGKHRWNFVARSTDKAPPMLVPRGRVTGGSSAVNAQIFLRGVPDDYDTWASLGNEQWSYQKLLPFFRGLETDTDYRGDFHGTDGPIIARRFPPDEWHMDQQAFYKSCRTARFPDCPDHNDPDSTGVGPTPMNNPDGVRWSTAIGYLSDARDRPNLTVMAECLVHRVLLDGNRAVGVLLERDGTISAEYGDETILSAGAIGSPHILMLSGIGPPSHLRSHGIVVNHDLPGVGQNLRDHPQVQVTWSTKEGYPRDPFAPKIQLTLRYTAQGSKLRNDMLIHPVSFSPIDFIKGDQMEIVGIKMVCCIDLALGVGEARLRSPDPHIQLFLDYNYLQEEFDRRRMREAVHICLDLAEHSDYGDIIDERLVPADTDLESDEALDDWMMRMVTTSHHVSGTCKMGPGSDPDAVVDQYGRVHGTEGLRVVDASIMPDCIRANTNVTAMVIGERVADFMRRGL